MYSLLSFQYSIVKNYILFCTGFYASVPVLFPVRSAPRLQVISHFMFIDSCLVQVRPVYILSKQIHEESMCSEKVRQ